MAQPKHTLQTEQQYVGVIVDKNITTCHAPPTSSAPVYFEILFSPYPSPFLTWFSCA